jgi:hypothetical protein
MKYRKVMILTGSGGERLTLLAFNGFYVEQSAYRHNVDRECEERKAGRGWLRG